MKEKLKKIILLIFPQGTIGYKLLRKIFVVENWSIRSDLFMHIRIIIRSILKFLHLDFLSPEMMKIKKIHNRHSGDRCFITCTGPSLTIADLEKLQNEITIGVNSIFLAYNETHWRPTYYVLVDVFHLSNMIFEHIDAINEICIKEAIIHPRISKHKAFSNRLNCLINYSNHKANCIKNKKIKLSNNPQVCIYDCFTVTNAAIQLAIYMGFKEIYLLGADCNYSNSKMHFVETEIDDCDRNAVWLPEAVRLSIDGYIATKKFALSNGVQIFNATRGGKLEVFDRVDFDTLSFKD